MRSLWPERAGTAAAADSTSYVVVERANYGVGVDLNDVVDIDTEALATCAQLVKLSASATMSDPAMLRAH